MVLASGYSLLQPLRGCHRGATVKVIDVTGSTCLFVLNLKARRSTQKPHTVEARASTDASQLWSGPT